MTGFDLEGVRKAFKIPDNYWIPMLLALGYFDQSKTLYGLKWRQSYQELVESF